MIAILLTHFLTKLRLCNNILLRGKKVMKIWAFCYVAHFDEVAFLQTLKKRILVFIKQVHNARSRYSLLIFFFKCSDYIFIKKNQILVTFKPKSIVLFLISLVQKQVFLLCHSFNQTRLSAKVATGCRLS